MSRRKKIFENAFKDFHTFETFITQSVLKIYVTFKNAHKFPTLAITFAYFNIKIAIKFPN